MIFTYDEQGKPFSLRYSKDGGSSFSQYYYATNAQGDVEGIFFTKKNTTTGKQEINWMGHYTYDAWGNILSIIAPNGTVVTNPAHLMSRNPLRYRGYYYDTETGFYYLQSRFYDPVNRRFINSDCYTSTGQGFLGYNMFAYCNNNPVDKVDYTGRSLKDIWDFITEAWAETSKAIAEMSYAYAGCGVAAAADGPLPIGDIIGGVFASVLVIYHIGCGVYAASQSMSRTEEEEKVDALTGTGTQSQPTVIYRHGGTNPGNLTPSQRYVELYPTTGKGLSFSTIPKPGAAMTTIEALNATGVVYAVRDGENHVSVFPVGGTLKDWRSAGASSIWTIAVKSVVVKCP